MPLFCRCGLALALLPLVAGAAPTSPKSPAPAPPPAKRAAAPAPRGTLSGLLDGAPVEHINLHQAIEMAMSNNLEAKFDKLGIQLEHAKVRFEIGAFDPTFSINMSRESLRRPENANDFTTTDQLRQNAQIQAINDQTAAIRESVDTTRALNGLPPISRDDSTSGTSFGTFNPVIFDQQNDRYSAGIVQRTPWGMRYGVFVEGNRLRNTFSGDGRQIFPEYQTTTSLQVVQPLLKDFGPGANLANVRVARIGEHMAFLAWKQRLMSSINLVAGTYYEMLYGVREVGVRLDAIAADEKLVRQNERRLEVGFIQPFDVQQARAQVSSDQEQLLNAKNLLMERQFTLKRLILDQFNASDSKVFLPREEPALLAPVIDRSLFLQNAFARRPDFQQALAEADAQDIRLRFAKNQMLPQLDLVATYGLNGLTDSFGNSFDQSFRGIAPAWTVGFNVRVPLGNIQGRAQVASARVLKQQAILKIKQSELSIGVDIDTVISRIETNRQRLETARKTRELYDEAVRIAYRRLDEGQISSFDIIEQQRRLYEAKSRELAAQTDLNKNVIQLWFVTGTILEKFSIEVKEPPSRHKPSQSPK